MSPATFTAAESIVPHIKTLDALHLGALIQTGLDAIVATHDHTMAAVAEQLGYETYDPVLE